MNYKSCLNCQKVYFKSAKISRQHWIESKYCSRQCQCIFQSRQSAQKRKNRIKLFCNTCKKEFEKIPSHIYKTNFCSQQCRFDFMNKQITKNCIVCKKECKIKRSRKNTFNYCSRQCFHIGYLGHNPSNFKGGRMTHKGYVYILKKGHPFADRDGYILEHRFVMEQHIGRYLTSKEIVHHKNHTRNDNRIENLELHKSQSNHMSGHYPKGKSFKQASKTKGF